MSDNTTTISVKRRNTQLVFDYCLDNEIAFSVKPAFAAKDEFEFSVNIENIKKAIAFGMFLKENKLELKGMATTAAPAAAKAKKPETKTNGAPAKEEASAEANGLAFDTNALMFDVNNG
ncbi:MAG: hypothetical protein V4667_02175 [Bacteroidota bacterium]